MRALTRFAFALFVGMTLCLAAATFVEKAEGTEFAARTIYHSGWFVLWWALLAVSALTVVAGRAVAGRPAAAALHFSFGLILLGALLTFMTARKGYVHLREGRTVNAYFCETSAESRSLPFGLRLDRFEIACYPGTQAPADYLSRVTVVDGQDTRAAVVSMNRVLSYRGYRFYQTSFDEDLRGSILSVNRDPYGIPVTYAGYLLLGFSMIGTLCSKRSGFRRLLRHPLLRRTGCLLFFVFGAYGAAAAPATLSRETADALGRLRILYDGRIAPVQTFARDFTLKIYGKPSYRGFSAEQVLAGWIFYPEQWQFERMIRVGQDTVRRSIGSGKTAALVDFFGTGRDYRLAGMLRLPADRNDSALKAFVEADEKVQLIAMLQSGRMLKLFPVVVGDGVRWFAPTDSVRGLPRGDSVFIKGIFPLLYEAVQSGRDADIRKLIDKTDAFQRERGGERFLPDARLRAELWYNRFDPVSLLCRINLCFGLLAFVRFVWSLAAGRRRRWVEKIFLFPLILSAVALTATLALRGYTAGHLPLSNGYETMLFVAWCVLLIALGLRRRFPIVTASGLLVSGFALLVAWLGMTNPQITPLVPVLRSPWLSLHVSLIMASYALFGLIMLNGTAALIFASVVRSDVAAKRTVLLCRLQLTGRLLLYPAVFLLVAGIFIGAVWANASWGRYWGWDPKEVWALVTLMLYALPLHGRSIVRFRDPLFFHAYCLWAFGAVLMTYFGVNYFLGGMHSYAGAFVFGSALTVTVAVVVVFVLLTVVARVRYKNPVPYSRHRRYPGSGSGN